MTAHEVNNLYQVAQGQLNLSSDIPAPATLPVGGETSQGPSLTPAEAVEPSAQEDELSEPPATGMVAESGSSVMPSNPNDTPSPKPTSPKLAVQRNFRSAQENTATAVDSNDGEALAPSSNGTLPLGPRSSVSPGWTTTSSTRREDRKMSPKPIPNPKRIANRTPCGRHVERTAPSPPSIHNSPSSPRPALAHRYMVFPQPHSVPQQLSTTAPDSINQPFPLPEPYSSTSPDPLPPPNLDGTNDPSPSAPPRRRLTSHSAKISQAHPDCWKCRSLSVLESGMRRLGHSCICGYRAEVVPGESHGLQTPNARHVPGDVELADHELEHARRTAPGARGRGHWTFRGSVAVPKGEVLRVTKERSRERRERERETWERGNEEALRHVGGVGVHDAPVRMGAGGTGSGLAVGRSDSVMGHGGLQGVEVGTVTRSNGQPVPVLVGGKGSEKHEVVEPVAVATRPVELGRGTTQLGTVTAPTGEAVPVKVRHRSSEHEVVEPVAAATRPVELARGTTQLGTVTAPTGVEVPVKVRHRSSKHEVVEPVAAATRPIELGRGTTQLGTVTAQTGEAVPVKVRHRSSEHEQVSRLAS